MNRDDKIDYHMGYHPCRTDRRIDIFELRKKIATFCDHTLPLRPKEPGHVYLDAHEMRDGSIDLYPHAIPGPRFMFLEVGRLSKETAALSVYESPRKSYIEVNIDDYLFRLHSHLMNVDIANHARRAS